MHTKESLERLSQKQLVATLTFILAWLKVRHPRMYRNVEKRAGLSASKRHQTTRRKRRSKVLQVPQNVRIRSVKIKIRKRRKRDSRGRFA
jgi:hypothetical protein